MKPCERFSRALYLWLAEPQLEAAFCQQSQYNRGWDFTFQASNCLNWQMN